MFFPHGSAKLVILVSGAAKMNAKVHAQGKTALPTSPVEPCIIERAIDFAVAAGRPPPRPIAIGRNSPRVNLGKRHQAEDLI
ncbi:MAG: hypothetical protein HY246_05260 [Proteobacteria bacterium]|nr:hypothetical protein [Pseudomonadota bacterium]